MENNSMLEKVLLECNRNTELLASWFQSDFSPMDEEEKFDNSEKFTEKTIAILFFICLPLLTFELSNIN